MTSSNKSRIPALSAVSCKPSYKNSISRVDSMYLNSALSAVSYKPSFKNSTSGFDSIYSNSSETSYRYGLFSTQRKSSNISRTNCYSAISTKGAKSLFHQTPKTDRKSIHAASASARRSSVSERNRQKDDRCLSDQNYQNGCIAKLIKFLTENGYPCPISSKFLKSPSKQDVVKVFEFILSKIDPNLVVTPIETRIPELMTSFGYPYYIAKSNLISFTGRQALGCLLGMFEFLVDNAQEIQELEENVDYEEIINPTFAPDDAVVDTRCMALVLDDEESIDLAFDGLTREVFGNIEEEHNRLIKEGEELSSTMETMEKETESFKTYLEKRDIYDQAMADYNNYNTKMENLILRDSEDAANAEREQENELAEIAALQAQADELENKVKEQPHNSSDIEFQREKQRQIDQETNENRQLIKKCKHDGNLINNEFSMVKAAITKQYANFASIMNTHLMELNSSSIKKYAPQVIEKINASELRNILDQFSRPDFITKASELKRKFIDSLNELNNCFIEFHVALQAESVRMQQKSGQLDVNETEKKKELEELQENLSHAEKDLQEFKQQCEAEKETLNSLNNQLQKTLIEKKSSMQIKMKKNADKITKLRQEISQQIEEDKMVTEQWETKQKNRREFENQLLQSIEKNLGLIHEAEKLAVADLREKVAGAKTAYERVLHVVEQNKRKAH